MKGGSGPGVLCDADAIYQAIFGAPATVVASTSVTYAMTDNQTSFAMYRYRSPSTASQMIGVGCVPSKVTWTLGSDVALCAVSGDGVFVIDSAAFSGYTNAEYKFGLSAFPAEVTGHTTTGTFAQGFRGAVTMDGNTIASIKSAVISADLNRKLVTSDFSSDLPTDIISDLRNVSINWVVDETDAAAINDLRQKTQQNGLVNMSIQIGIVPGSIHTITLTNVQLTSLTTDRGNQGQFTVSFADSQAFGTAANGGTDAIVYVQT